MKFYKAKITDSGLTIEKIVNRTNKPKDGKGFIYLDEESLKSIDKKYIKMNISH